MNIFQLGRIIMGVLSDNPSKEPMHYGEVYGIWSYLNAAKAALVAYQVFYNHAGDADLRAFIEDIIRNAIKPQIEETEKLLKENGVALPPTPPERAVANRENIPVGARFNDPEIAFTIASGISATLIACSQIMGQSIREDIGMMFGQFHMTNAQYGLRLLRMQKEKGWLVTPPLHVRELEPVGV
ncbi:MAG: DUF3231 family protein [Bacillota bacterium]